MSYSQKNEPFSMRKSPVEISAGSRKGPVQVGEFFKEILESLVIWGNWIIVDGIKGVARSKEGAEDMLKEGQVEIEAD